MGKKQHQKDKLYLTCSEWTQFYGGKKQNLDKERAEFRRLPYHSCSLSMQPFEHPYCTKEGVIYDLQFILPFLKKYGVNPVDGEKLTPKDLIKLNFHKNAHDKYHCPVTFKVFNENTHLVAVKQTGNVYAYEAVEQLNIKAKFWKDLLSDEPFTRQDIITVQDPSNLDKFNFSKYYHLKKNLKVVDEEEALARKDPRYHLKAVNLETRDVLDELDKGFEVPEYMKKKDDRKYADRINAAHYSTGMVGASFTSTAMTPETKVIAEIIDENILRYERIKKKAYVRITTTCGQLNLELHSDQIPRASENFLVHCQNNYYKDTVFHRSIRNFMIQGGDPIGDGTGGESIWEKPFQDEFKPNFSHVGRGVLCMANSGPNTNKSQFYITYRSCKHLDRKHTVFGRVVGGLETIDKMEKIEVDAKDKPKDEIKILGCQVFVNPYEEVDEMLVKERQDVEEKAIADAEAAKPRRPATIRDAGPKVFRAGVGKYINLVSAKKRTIDDDEDGEKKKKSKGKTHLEDFSAW